MDDNLSRTASLGETITFSQPLTKPRSGRPKKKDPVKAPPSEESNIISIESSFQVEDFKVPVVELDGSSGFGNSIGSVAQLGDSNNSSPSVVPRHNQEKVEKPQKCMFSPYAFHRWARTHKEKLKDGTISLILRCRYCMEMQQVLVRWKRVNGRYVAFKEISSIQQRVDNE